ncbi:hypothetical protein [Runella sp.]|uniref:hypothetical protein n=1 Tax=Runella sp. TaxID=1960881 RepID=UPI003D0A66A5
MILYLECYPDEALANSLGISIKHIDHSKGRNKVCDSLCKTVENKGLIDEDPLQVQHPIQKEWKLQSTQFKVKYFKDEKRGHKIICLCPDLENWIVEVAKAEKIDLKKDFRLENNAKDLHKVIHLRLTQFKELVKELENRQSKPILHLKSLLNL